MRDLRYALRALSRNPGFSLAAILVLALGIGANSAIFTVIRAVLLAPLPYPDPDRLVRLYERDVVGTYPFNVVSGPNFYDWKKEANSFEAMGFYGDWSASLSPSDGGLPEDLDAAICEPGFFRTLGVQPILGRAFSDEDDQQDAPRVVVISHALWVRRFGADPAILGSTIRLGVPYTVIGVMPETFDFPTASVSVWFPVARMINPNYRLQRGNHRFQVIARLKRGVSTEQARTELDGIAKRIRQQYPEALTGRGANVASLAERDVSRVRPMLLVLFGAVGCVLLIACVNVTNLLLARAVARKREVAVRIALGAGRSRIARQFLAESLLISIIGASIGLALAILATGPIIKMAGYIPRIEKVHVNAIVLVFTAAVAILTGLVVGLVPALTSSRHTLSSSMQEGGRSTTAGRGRGLFRDGLIAVEVALSLMLLIGAGLMLKSFANLRAVDPGFNPDRMLTLGFALPPQNYKTPGQIAAFYRDLLDRVRAMPGVQTAGIITVAPLRGHFMDNTFTVDGHPPLPPGHFLDAVVRSVDPEFFKAAGIALKRGRVFTPAEWLDGADKAVITESMARTFFRDEDPIGKRIRTERRSSFEIVGIVADTRQNLASPPEPMMYFPLFRGDMNFATLLVRTSGDPNLLSLPIQKEMRALDSDLPAVTVKTMDEIMWGSTQQSRFGLTLIGLFAGLAVVLASIGLYGVLAYSVGQRTSELGVRMALGASRSAISKLVVLQGFKPALVGIALGVAGGIAGTRLLQSSLFEVSPIDPAVIGGVAVLLIAITLAACFVPAWRATRIDPAVALRVE
jgi:putative ABC transport system permease protein